MRAFILAALLALWIAPAQAGVSVNGDTRLRMVFACPTQALARIIFDDIAGPAATGRMSREVVDLLSGGGCVVMSNGADAAKVVSWSTLAGKEMVILDGAKVPWRDNQVVIVTSRRGTDTYIAWIEQPAPSA